MKRFGIVVLALLALGCERASPTTAEVADELAFLIVSGDGQEGFPNEELPNPLVVEVTDSKGRGIKNQLVNFRVVEGAGTVFARIRG